LRRGRWLPSCTRRASRRRTSGHRHRPYREGRTPSCPTSAREPRASPTGVEAHHSRRGGPTSASTTGPRRCRGRPRTSREPLHLRWANGAPDNVYRDVSRVPTSATAARPSWQIARVHRSLRSYDPRGRWLANTSTR
jgi:hypothetical protein